SSLRGGKDLQKITVDTSTGTPVLLVGGTGGVFRRIGTGPWSEFGVGLPNLLVTDVDFVTGTRNSHAQFDSVLVAATLGRGAWTIPDAGRLLNVPATVVVTGTSANETFYLERDLAQPWIANIFLYPTGSSKPTSPAYRIPFASLESIHLNGLGGDDAFIVDFRTGPISLPDGVIIDGGASILGNTLEVLG